MPVRVAFTLAARAAPGMGDTEAESLLRDNTKPSARSDHAITYR